MSHSDLYPPAPAGVPPDLAKPGLRYRLQAMLVLLSLFLFLLVYLVLLGAAIALMAWVVWPSGASSVAAEQGWQVRVALAATRIGIFALALMLFAFLLKGLFKRGEEESPRNLEVTESAQPELFQFIRALCHEIGCAVPARVCLSDEVNAAVQYPTSILNLVMPPRKTLVIGLGLVSDLSLVEFKALLAHELGHFSQRTLRLDGYVWVAYQVIANMVNTRDRWDTWVVRGFDTPWVSAFAVPLYVLAELTRTGLKAVFGLLQRAQLSMRRQMEFNADLVAVSVAGSDALIRLLYKSNQAYSCQEQVGPMLALAAEQGLFSRDLFFHQQRAAESLRADGKSPARLPEEPADGFDGSPPADFFQPEDDSSLAMWADHPSHYDREQNAKARYFQSPRDDRLAWLLFRDQEAVRADATRSFYRACLNLTTERPLADPEHVQLFIDEELASLRFDVRYRGVYDHRYLELDSLEQCARDSATPPVNRDGLAASLSALYSDELASWVAAHQGRREEADKLERLCSSQAGADEEFQFRGRKYPVADARTLLQNVETELEEDRRYLANFDRSVFSLHDELAIQLGKQTELRQRYDFHLRLQTIVRLAWEQRGSVESVLAFFHANREVHWEEVSHARDILAQVQDRLAGLYQSGNELSLPDLKHLPADAPIITVLPAAPDLPELSSSDSYAALDFQQLAFFHRYLVALTDRLSTIQVKSLVDILAYQEQLVAELRSCQMIG